MNYQLAVLLAFGRLGKNVYGGTVPQHVVAKRRAKDKVARAQRKTNRSK